MTNGGRAGKGKSRGMPRLSKNFQCLLPSASHRPGHGSREISGTNRSYFPDASPEHRLSSKVGQNLYINFSERPVAPPDFSEHPARPPDFSERPAAPPDFSERPPSLPPPTFAEPDIQDGAPPPPPPMDDPSDPPPAIDTPFAPATSGPPPYLTRQTPIGTGCPGRRRECPGDVVGAIYACV